MYRIGYTPGAFDLFHIGYLDLLRKAREQYELLIAGGTADEALIEHKGVTPTMPLAERLDSGSDLTGDTPFITYRGILEQGI
ncbi:adenylyltransferase/cytidyltransferase family protein [Burkholderia sp. D-99]|uniref:adenylyltransferase/cytidyltransferase family protein n=1 Tax=Burkholderia sp. D-99 TaxID=2717316 RepID=UPI0014239871|nr:adenylyltransferase/cytidyltransferase family protein [Burkholderia sp. D-99]NHV26916.1 adenylyltransferase/cytidyltransferase family protein [Burkholderia sp. D-99]